jgi:Ulp1 family protease
MQYDLIAFKYGIKITMNDIKTLDPKQRLNDNIIDIYLKHLTSNSNSLALESSIFNAFFHHGFDSIKRKLLMYLNGDYHSFIVPTCFKKHWRLIIIIPSSTQII